MTSMEIGYDRCAGISAVLLCRISVGDGIWGPMGLVWRAIKVCF